MAASDLRRNITLVPDILSDRSTAKKSLDWPDNSVEFRHHSHIGYVLRNKGEPTNKVFPNNPHKLVCGLYMLLKGGLKRSTDNTGRYDRVNDRSYFRPGTLVCGTRVRRKLSLLRFLQHWKFPRHLRFITNTSRQTNKIHRFSSLPFRRNIIAHVTRTLNFEFSR